MISYRLFVRPFRQLLKAFLLSVFCLHPVWADDTEIFFSPVSGAEAQPNILLLLDASHSMVNYDCADGSSQWQEGPCSDDSHNGNTTRLERMNNALSEVINNISGVNLGIMRFSNTRAGGRVIYPLRDIDQVNVRDELIHTLYNDMEVQLRTPTVGGMIEATRYFAGQDVLYGKTRWSEENRNNGRFAYLEHGRYSRVSHPDSYTGGQVIRTGDCTEDDPDHEDCADEHIAGTPVYTSPIKSECQANHIILVTDGLPNAPDGNTENLARALTETNCSDYSGNRRCATEVADYLYTTDFLPEVDGLQNVSMHTIGFNLSSSWLEDIATAKRNVGGTEVNAYYEAQSSVDLVDAVTSIVVNSADVDAATFVAPGATLDQFSRIAHRNDVYLALFRPDATPGWSGNLKHYDLKGNPVNLFDADNEVAVNADGSFVADSRSFWSEPGTSDGHDITLGGAASNLPYHADREAVTYTGTDEKGLFADVNELSGDNDLLIFLRPDSVTNVALGGSASQSSTSSDGVAERAIDNNTNGRFFNAARSVTHTATQAQPWWTVTLQQNADIDRIVLHNRTDGCCVKRLNDVHVFVSETPFGNATLEELKAQPGIWKTFVAGEQGTGEIVLPVDTTGQYVRVQLAGDNATLSLAEVQVFGARQSEEVLAEKQNIINWARGMDVKDENEDGDTSENRYHMGDPLHSRPVIVNYGGTASDPDSVVFVGTNEGYLHAIDIKDGVEEFAFMPQELINNLEPLYENKPGADKVYGMDGDLTVWANDVNNNGAIEADGGDHAYLYAGMRRGGSKYYALDVSDRADPKFLFSIPESDPAAFAELGQSWSKPILSSIRVSSTEIKKVLIFAGGYDVSQDEKSTTAPDTTGRAIYIVDAEKGTVLWSAQPNGVAGGTTRLFADMQYSIPSDIRVVTNEDGLASQLYVGDMGGQLWRFDIPNDGSTGADIANGGVIARFNEAGEPKGARRFYHAPDLAFSNFEGERVLNIGIGSGYHAHPLNTAIEDNFYLIRYPFKATGNYGMKDTTTVAGYRPITMSDLFDTTDNLIGEGDEEEIADAQAELRSAEGWFITMERNGEKILGSSNTLDHVVRFVSYVPGNSGNICAPDLGSSTFWRVSLEDGTPVPGEASADDTDDTDTDTSLKKDDRSEELPGGGIAPPVQTIFVASDGEVKPTVVSGTKVLEGEIPGERFRRWFWAEYPE